MHDARGGPHGTSAAAEPAALRHIRLTDEGELAGDGDGAPEAAKSLARGARSGGRRHHDAGGNAAARKENDE